MKPCLKLTEPGFKLGKERLAGNDAPRLDIRIAGVKVCDQIGERMVGWVDHREKIGAKQRIVYWLRRLGHIQNFVDWHRNSRTIASTHIHVSAKYMQRRPPRILVNFADRY